MGLPAGSDRKRRGSSRESRVRGICSFVSFLGQGELPRTACGLLKVWVDGKQGRTVHHLAMIQ